MSQSARSSAWMAAAVAGCVAVTLTAGCGGGPTPPSPAPTPFGRFEIPGGLSPALTAMLEQLPTYIIQARQRNEDSLPRNPHLTTLLQERIDMLRNPSLAGEIADGRRWSESEVTSIDGRSIPLVTIFPLEGMRSEAADALRTLAQVLPLVERFLDLPFPTPVIRVWYGFVLGNSGGGGVIYTEDRTTYEGRTGPTRLPHDAILGHELSHSYISNESLTQFLETYAWNVLRTGSTEALAWTMTRPWVPGSSTNQDLAAVLDVYRLIGHDAMARGYRAIHPLRPPYGQPLSAAVIEAFAAEAPAEHRAAVVETLRRVTF